MDYERNENQKHFLKTKHLGKRAGGAAERTTIRSTSRFVTTQTPQDTACASRLTGRNP